MAELIGVGIQLCGCAIELGVGAWDSRKNKNKKKKEEAEGGSHIDCTSSPTPSSCSGSATSSPALGRHGATTSGYFVKEGHLRKTWKRRWFVLKGTTLTYHKSEQDKMPRGKIKLKGSHAHITTRHTDTTYGVQECLVIEDKKQGKTFHLFPCGGENKEAEARQLQAWLGTVEECGGAVVQAPASPAKRRW